MGSRFTHAAASRYAPIEGEALAIADALDKARFFVLGCDNLIIAVDHKPLLKIFDDRCLEDISNDPLSEGRFAGYIKVVSVAFPNDVVC